MITGSYLKLLIISSSENVVNATYGLHIPVSYCNCKPARNSSESLLCLPSPATPTLSSLYRHSPPYCSSPEHKLIFMLVSKPTI